MQEELDERLNFSRSGEPATEDARPQFMRSGIAGPFGELDIDVAGKVDPATASAFQRICRLNNTTRSAAIRDFVYLTVHGRTYEQLCLGEADRRAEWLQATGPEKVLPARDVARTA